MKEPTRIRDNNEPSVLDLIITNEENMIGITEYKPGLGKSDNLGLLFVFNCYTEFIYELGIFHANQTTKCLRNQGRTKGEGWSTAN